MEVNMSVNADMSFTPTLHDVHNLLDESVVGEFEARMAVFTNWLLAHRNVNLAGQRASGKTHISVAVAKFLPDKNGLYNITSGSDKSGWYQAEALKKHSHIMIPELNKMPKDMLEVLKDWGEDRDSEYRVTVVEGGVRSVRKYKLPRKPFIFCLADEQEEKIDDQLRSRLTVIRTDSGEAQNVAVNIQQAKMAMLPDNPFNVKDDKLFDKMKHHILTLPPMSNIQFKHPSATSFVSCIPTYFTDCRRDFPKYLSNTFGITRFFWKHRLYVNINNINTYISTPEDMYLNHIIYGNTLVESSLRCSNMERHLINILQQASEALNRQQIQSAVRQMGLNISAHMITRHLTTLADLGYIAIEKTGYKNALYSPGPLFKEFNFSIDWKQIIEDTKENIIKYYPTIAEEYIRRFCDNPTAIHPFTGQKINLLDLKVEEHKPQEQYEKFEVTNENIIEQEQDAFDDFTDDLIVEEEVVEE